MQRLANLTLTFLLILTGIAIFAAVEADSEKPEARATTLAEITATDWLPTADARKIGGYWLAYDGRTKSARYTVEILTPDSLREMEGVGRASGFRFDFEAPPECRAVDSDYAGSGYDRGHLACSANYHLSDSDQRETFRLSNVIPQTPESNRGPVKQCEAQIRDIAEMGSVVICITAPIYLADERGTITVCTIGGNRVWVPTHTGKAICCYIKGDRPGIDPPHHIAAWIIPNTNSPGELDECRVTVDVFEAAAGIDVFSILPDNVEYAIERKL
jgi:endonuclease G, mitochondrial